MKWQCGDLMLLWKNNVTLRGSTCKRLVVLYTRIHTCIHVFMLVFIMFIVQFFKLVYKFMLLSGKSLDLEVPCMFR